MPDKAVLKQLQSLPLEAKVVLTQQRIKEWYEYYNGDVSISFSGGKDSTVLAHLVHELYPDVPLVYVDTGLEYPEVREFARRMGAIVIRPKMMFNEVITRYGYPLISKDTSEAINYARKIKNGNPSKWTTHRRSELKGQRTFEWGDWRRKSTQGVDQFSKENKSMFNKEKWLPLCNQGMFKISNYCCAVMKKGPLMSWQNKNKSKPFIGTLAEESKLRQAAWISHGCNAFDGGKHATSQPLSFWTEQDILRYILNEGIEIAKPYGQIVCTDDFGFNYEPIPGIDCKLKCTGYERTGCIFCGFGFHLEKKGMTRFQRLAMTHPKQYEYCLGGGQWVDNPDYDPTAPKMDGNWENWNPKKIWVPSKEGLGMKKVFDDCNALYGKDFMRYE